MIGHIWITVCGLAARISFVLGQINIPAKHCDSSLKTATVLSNSQYVLCNIDQKLFAFILWAFLPAWMP